MDLNFKQYSSEGYPLIILHGLFGNLSNWGWHSKALASQFQVYGLDLRNHGASPHSDDMDYPLMVADVLEFLDAQGIERCHVLGHSMGGKVAMELALSTPQQVKQLMVVDIAPVDYLSTAAAHDQVFAGMEALDLSALGSRQQADKILSEFVSVKETRLFLLANLRKDSEAGYAWRLNLPSLHKNYDILRMNVESTGPFVGETLFVKGGESAYINSGHRQQILELFPRANVKVVLNAGHWLHSEKPQALLKICQQFFEESP